MATSFSKKQSPTGASQANRGLYKKGGSAKKYATGGSAKILKKAAEGTTVKPISPKPVVKKSTEKASNIYAKNPTTGKEEQMVIKAGKYAFPTKKKGGSTKAMPKAMYGKSMMKKGGAKKK